MNITYLGHSCFKLKGKVGTVVTDPFHSYVGFNLPAVSADIVTISHSHQDHNQVQSVSSSSRRSRPFVIDMAGEYEVGGISVFGTKTYHDSAQGIERGENIAYVIYLDGLRVCHLGDLGHELTVEQRAEIGAVDVLLCPVGGVFTIDPKTAVAVIKSLEPSIVIPMHYKTPLHDEKVFGELATLHDFLVEYGVEVKAEDKLLVEKGRLPEETEVVVLERS